MTENTSDFVQEPSIGDSADIPQENEKIDATSEDLVVKNIDNCINSHKDFNFTVDDLSKEEVSCALDSTIEEKIHLLQDHWLKLSTFFRKVYHTILDGEKPPEEYECHMEIVKELVLDDPHQLFARLEMDLQEFIIAVKLRQMELLNCIHTEEGPHLFIFCLIEGYNKLMFAANTLSPIFLQLEIEHLSKFKIDWLGLNQHLFHKLVFTEPKIQKVLPFCISKLGKMNSELSDFNKRLIRQFLTFDDEMTKIGGKWREAETAIIKYHQENSMLDAKERMMKINWELIKTQTKVFHEELKSSGLCDNYFSESFKKIKIEAENSEDQEPFSVDSLMDSTFLKSCFHDESPCLDSEILAHLNADGKKMYSHLHKFKVQRDQLEQEKQNMMNGLASPQISPTEDMEKEDEEMTNHNVDQTSTESPPRQQPRQPSQLPTSPIELHKTLIRKQQQQKKLMQMMQSSQQKDIQHKIQKQLQEHQALLQQQRKIDELQAHLLQQHPIHLDKEMQKKVHLQMQHRLIQKHKQMEEKFHQQVQHHLQHHQDKSSSTVPKSNMQQKTNQNQSNMSTCNHSKSALSMKSNHKCSTSIPTQSKNPMVNLNVSVSLSASVSTAKPTTTNASVGVGVTHKNSTTQTTAASTAGQNVRHHPLPDVVKSAAHICPKHTEANKNIPHNHMDHCNSSDNSSDDDYGSERSNSPQRHCDCCYCEVFGSAPVSRNFQETRERLRLILTKKKAKSNSVAVNNDKQTSEQNASNCANVNNAVQQTSQNVGKVKKVEPQSSDTKVKQAPAEYKGDKSIEEILDFIEGNKIRNLKRTAKKMRRKQRQLEEEERRRKEEEAERLRQEEIRRKEEEKKRIEEERRRQELMRSKKGKKKNSKQNPQQNAAQANQQNSGKNKKKTQQDKTNEKTKLAQNQCIKNANQKPPHNQPTQQKKGKQDQQQNKQTNKAKIQPEKQQKGQQFTKNNVISQKKSQNQQKNGSKDENSQPQMVTIKRVMQPNSSEPTVTITLRGSTPKEDKVLYTLMNGQMCQVKDEKGKKQTSSGSGDFNNKKNNKAHTNVTHTFNNTYSSPNPQPITLPSKSIPFNKSCSIIGNGVSNITERMERLKLSSQPVQAEATAKAPGATQAELTTPTAIQINQAVNQLSSRPTFPSNFDLENIKLPPGITITKVDPASVNRKPIQAKQQAPPPPPPQTHVRQSMMSSMPGASNVIVVDTGDKGNYYQTEDQAVDGMKKKRRRRKKDQNENGQTNSISNMPQQFGAPNGLPPRMGPINAGMYGNPFMNNDYRNPPQQAAAIIQMNGSMVTIRNPALHQALAGQQMDYQDDGMPQHNDNGNPITDETMFPPAPEELESDDVDEYERELEAFKRFCSQSVPAESKPKVNLNLEDIVLKKKGPVIGCS